MRQGEEQKPVQWAAKMYPAMACLRAERWKLLSWALPVQGWPKSFLISIKQRQLATRNFFSHRINIGTPRNNLLVGIEALKIILWPISSSVQILNATQSGKCQSKYLFLVNIKIIFPDFHLLLAVLCLSIYSTSTVLATHLQWYQRWVTKRVTGYLLIDQGSSCLVPPHHWLDKLFYRGHGPHLVAMQEWFSS